MSDQEATDDPVIPASLWPRAAEEHLVDDGDPAEEFPAPAQLDSGEFAEYKEGQLLGEQSSPAEPSELVKNGLPETAITGFAVLLTEAGTWIGTSNINLASLIDYDHPAEMADFISGGQTVSADALQLRLIASLSNVLAQIPAETANRVVTVLDEKVARMGAMAQGTEILKGIGGRGGLRGGRPL